MLGVYAIALLVLAASALAGRALLYLLGWRTPTWLSPAIGFAALCVIAPLLIRLPGRATTAAILLGLVLIACSFLLRRPGRGDDEEGRGTRVSDAATLPSRRRRMRPRRGEGRAGTDTRGAHTSGLAVALIVLAAASLPFLFNERVGVLGEGIYTNDQAAQLYWADWLQDGFGPEPGAVRFGYPTGPQSVTAVAAEATGVDLDDAFDGLLLAIPVLTALAALAALTNLPPVRRTIAASLVGLPFLATSFLAQSAFKETAMALFVLAFAVICHEVSRGAPRRAGVLALAVIAAATVFTYSLPGLVWFAVALPAWLVLELIAARRLPNLEAARDALRRHRLAVAIAVVVVAVVAVLSAGQVSKFVDKVGQVQASAGRLSSPVFPGEAFGVWPEGDFRVVRGEVSGAIPAALLGLLAVGLGGVAALRRRDLALAATLGAAGVVYLGAREFGSIYVEAKSLAVLSPIAMLVALRFLLAEEPTPSRSARSHGIGLGRQALGALFAALAIASTFLALRAAPVGFDDRGEQLESLAGRIDGDSVVFLGVDRFAGYWLRGTLVKSPGGYVPAEVGARPQKIWRLGRAMDFDTLTPNRLDQFDYAITTAAAYQSSPLPSFERVDATDSYVLWRRIHETPRDEVLDEGGDPGRVLDCSTQDGRRAAQRGDEAIVLPDPVTGSPNGWSRTSPFEAPGDATQKLRLAPGRWQLSLQYQSQASLTVKGPDGETLAELPPSLDGMYLTHQGQGAFWPAGEVRIQGHAPATFTVEADDPSGLQDALGVGRQTWLGKLAATRPGPGGAGAMPVRDACGRYLDRYTLG